MVVLVAFFKMALQLGDCYFLFATLKNTVHLSVNAVLFFMLTEVFDHHITTMMCETAGFVQK